MINRLTGPFLRLFSPLLAAILAVVLSSSAPSHAQDGTAKQFLQGIYKQYQGKNAQGSDLSGWAKASRYFDDAMTALIVKDQQEAQGEAGRMDFDPFINAQDFSIKSVEVAIASEDEESTKGTVSFSNAGRWEVVNYDLVRTNKGWRIANISWRGTRDTLRSILQQPL